MEPGTAKRHLRTGRRAAIWLGAAGLLAGTPAWVSQEATPAAGRGSAKPLPALPCARAPSSADSLPETIEGDPDGRLTILHAAGKAQPRRRFPGSPRAIIQRTARCVFPPTVALHPAPAPYRAARRRAKESRKGPRWRGSGVPRSIRRGPGAKHQVDDVGQTTQSRRAQVPV